LGVISLCWIKPFPPTPVASVHESTPPAFCPIYECHLHDNIELLPYSEVVGVEGKGGDFNVSVVRKPRFVDPKRCTLCDACVKVCPVEVEREFGGGLENRKAIYLPYPQAIPHSLVIDPKTCTRCGECVKVCSPGQSIST